MAPDRVLIVRVASLPFDRLDALSNAEDVAALEALGARAEHIDQAGEALESDLYAAAGPAPAAATSRDGEPSGSPEAATAVAAVSERLVLLEARRAVHHRRIPPLAAVARELQGTVPGLAASLSDFANELEHLEQVTVAYRARHAAAVLRDAERLAALGNESIFQEGVRLVSRSLFAKAEQLAQRPAAEWKHRERHTALKLAAYLARAASKTSPNGVFCATALGEIGSGASCRGENAIVARDVLLAVGEARKIAACLAVDPEFAPLVFPRPNPTLRVKDGSWTFWRPASPRRPDDDEVLASTKIHPVARTMLDRCAPERTFADLIAEVSRQTGIAADALEPFARKMIESGLLIAEAEIPWSARRPLRHLAEAGRAAGCAGRWSGEIDALERAVDEVSRLEWPVRGRRIDAIEAQAETLPHQRPLLHDELVRVDAATGFQMRLPHGAIAELETFMDWYVRLYAALYPRQRFIEWYARRFLAAHPADTDVELLDLYHGVFEPRSETRPAAFPAPSGAGPLADRARGAFDRVRERFAVAARTAQSQGRDEVELDTLDWESTLGDDPAPPWSCGVLFQVAARDAPAIDTGDYRLALNGLYSGGGLAVARLAHLHAGGGRAEDGPIARELRESWGWLERDGAVIAELSFMHDGRTANAGLRPSLFRYEIELAGDRATPGREVIPLAELTVRFDSAARRFRLRWPHRGLDVLPIVSSGINPEGLVQFLLEVGRQDLQPLALFPGLDVEGITRWPRFRLGRVVAFRRRWIFPPGAWPATAALGPLDHRRMIEVSRWRRRHGLPRRVFAHTATDPKPFYVDLESPWLVELLARRLADSPETTLAIVEMLPAPDEMWVRDQAGRYAAEFLVHLSHVGESSSPGART